MCQKGSHIGCTVQQPAHRPPQREGVHAPAQTQRGHIEYPDPPVPPHQGKHEQGKGEAQPEQGVQQMLQPAPAQPVAEHPHTVIDHSRRSAQQSRTAEERRLIHLDLHRIQTSSAEI